MKTESDRLEQLMAKPWLPYVLPFALFLLLTEPARFFPELSPYFYIAKTILVGALLYFWRYRYADDLSPRLSSIELLTAIFCGLLVLVIWIAPEQYLFQIGESAGFDPHALGGSQAAAFGAALSVMILGTGVMRYTGAAAVTITNPYLTTISAFVFCLLTTGVLIGISKMKKSSPMAMILTGVALGSLFQAGTMFLQFFADRVCCNYLPQSGIEDSVVRIEYDIVLFFVATDEVGFFKFFEME